MTATQILLVPTLALLAVTFAPGADATIDRPGIVRAEFVYEKAPFPSCHASTIAETHEGLVAAWFGGADEGKPDVGIWIARDEGKGWSKPVEVARWDQDGKRLPCWNPVLYQAKGGPLLLFYKAGPSPSNWWGMLVRSDDAGKTWSTPTRLPDGILGPIKNKPIARPDGSLLCPSSSEDRGWLVHFERTPDLGKTWEKTGPINEGGTFKLIQPTILALAGGRLEALCRSEEGSIVETRSADGGKTWSLPSATPLPNPDSGLDAVTLADGRHLLVYNHTSKARSPLNIAVSADGTTWKAALVLEDQPGEYSYPAVIQTADGLVHITYTWHRKKIRHVVVDPTKLILRDMDGTNWPKD